MTLYEDCEITQDGDGVKHATSLDGIVSVVPDGETKLFLRNAKRPFAEEGRRHVRVIVGELDGVRVYVLGNRVIMTKQDLNF